MLTTSRAPVSYVFDCLLFLDSEWRKAKIRQHYTLLRFEEQAYVAMERDCVRDVVKALQQLEKEVAEALLALTPSRQLAIRALMASFTRIRSHLDARCQETRQ